MSSTTTATSNRWRGEPLTMGQLGRVLLRHWILLVIGVLVGALAGFLVARVTPPVYTATSTMLIKAVPGTSPSANYEAAQYAVARAKAYPVFIYNLSIIQQIQSDLGSHESTSDLQKDLTASTIADTPLVQITATGSSPSEARDKANAALREMSQFITQIETVNGRSPISVEVAVLAGNRPDPISPRPLLYIALGALVGLALAIGAALIHAYARSTHPGPKRRAAHQRRGHPRDVSRHSERAATHGEAETWVGQATPTSETPADSTQLHSPDAVDRPDDAPRGRRNEPQHATDGSRADR